MSDLVYCLWIPDWYHADSTNWAEHLEKKQCNLKMKKKLLCTINWGYDAMMDCQNLTNICVMGFHRLPEFGRLILYIPLYWYPGVTKAVKSRPFRQKWTDFHEWTTIFFLLRRLISSIYTGERKTKIKKFGIKVVVWVNSFQLHTSVSGGHTM